MNRKNNTDLATLLALQELITSAERSLHHARNLMSQLGLKKPVVVDEEDAPKNLHVYKHDKAKIVEGIFTGKDMLGADKNLYPVPANYASKSKIVEGSKLKMTLKSDGSYQYKIIAEIPFETTTGTLIKDGEHFMVISQSGIYQVLPASVTYLQARIGDRVAIRIPQGTKATYATIDTIVPADLGLIEA